MVDDEPIDAGEGSKCEFYSLGTVLVQDMSDMDSKKVQNVHGRALVEIKSLEVHPIHEIKSQRSFNEHVLLLCAIMLVTNPPTTLDQTVLYFFYTRDIQDRN